MKDHNAIRDRFSKDFQLDLSTELTDNLIATIQSGGYTPTHNMKMAGSGAYHIYHRSLAGWPGYENLLDSVDEAEIVISDSLPRTIP